MLLNLDFKPYKYEAVKKELLWEPCHGRPPSPLFQTIYKKISACLKTHSEQRIDLNLLSMFKKSSSFWRPSLKHIIILVLNIHYLLWHTYISSVSNNRNGWANLYLRGARGTLVVLTRTGFSNGNLEYDWIYPQRV